MRKETTLGFRIINRIFMVCFGLAMIFLLWAVITRSNQGLAVFTIIAVGLIAWFVQPRRTGAYILLLIAISFGIKYYAITHLFPTPIQDFKTVLDAAQGLVRGDTSFNQLKYFYDWAYQTPFVLYDTLLLKINQNIQTIKLVNALAAVGINVLIYATLRGHLEERYAKAVTTFFAFMPFTAITGTWLSNQPMATFLTYLGLYFFVKNGKIISNGVVRTVVAGVLVACGNLMRPEGIVIIVAVTVFIVIKWSKKANKQATGWAIKKFVCFMVPYILIGVVASQLIMATGINPNGIANNNPWWKFTLGFNHESKGMWNKEDYDWLQSQEAMAGNQSVKDIQMPVIKQRIFDHPTFLPKLFADKVRVFWAFPRIYPAFEYLKEVDQTKAYEKEKLQEVRAERQYYVDYFDMTDVWLFLILVALSAIGCFQIIRSSNRENRKFEGNVVFAYIIFATFVIYLLIEVQPRYVYFVQPAVAIVAAYGLKFIDELRRNQRG